MNWQEKKRVREVRVGAVIVMALVIIVGFVFGIGGEKKMFGGKVKYKILFDATGGLFKGDPVMLTGVEVGNVVKLSFPEDVALKKILVEIAVLEEVAPRIRQDSRARIAAASLVYGKVVELSMGSAEYPVLEPDTYIEAIDPTNMGAIVDSTNLMVDDIRQVLAKVNRGQGAVGQMINDDLELKETLHHLSLTSQRLSRLADGMVKGQGPLGSLFSDSLNFYQSIRDLQTTVSSLDSVSRNLQGNQSVLGKLINDPVYGDEVTRDLSRAIKSLANITAKVDTGEGSLGQIINDEELYVGLQDVVLGIQKNKLAKWAVQNRRKAGEKKRMKIEEMEAEQEGK